MARHGFTTGCMHTSNGGRVSLQRRQAFEDNARPFFVRLPFAPERIVDNLYVDGFGTRSAVIWRTASLVRLPEIATWIRSMREPSRTPRSSSKAAAWFAARS